MVYHIYHILQIECKLAGLEQRHVGGKYFLFKAQITIKASRDVKVLSADEWAD